MTPNYSREDVDYASWYSPWMKMLAKNHTRAELEIMLNGNAVDAKKYGVQHLRAIESTHSMQSQSQRRAQTGNLVRASGDKAIALRGALEIYDLFPEFAKGSK